MKDYLPLLKETGRYFSLAQSGIDNALSKGLELLLEALNFYAAHIFLYNPLTDFLECQQTIVRGRGVIAGEGKIQLKNNENNLMVQVFSGQMEYALSNDKLDAYVVIKKPGGQPIGILVADKLKNSILEQEIELLKDFADELGVGIYDINRFLEEQQKRSKFQALCKIAGSLTSTLKLKEILGMILDSCVNDLKFDRAKVYLKDDKKEIICGYMSVDMRGIVEKIEKESYSMREKGNRLVEIALGRENKLIEEEISKLLLFMPLKVKNRILGILVVDNIFSRQIITDEDKDALKSLSNQAALIIENAQLFKKVQALSVRDGLTELYNYRFLKQRLLEELKRTERFNDKLSLLILDIDNFKSLNDTYGHQTGDRILKCFANLALKNLRSIDLLTRYGGDEFVALLPRTGPKQAKKVAFRLKKAVQNSGILISKSKKVSFTISIGVSIAPDDAREVETLIKAADRALYLAKKQGKNRVCVAKKS